MLYRQHAIYTIAKEHGIHVAPNELDRLLYSSHDLQNVKAGNLDIRTTTITNREAVQVYFNSSLAFNYTFSREYPATLADFLSVLIEHMPSKVFDTRRMVLVDGRYSKNSSKKLAKLA